MPLIAEGQDRADGRKRIVGDSVDEPRFLAKDIVDQDAHRISVVEEASCGELG